MLGLRVYRKDNSVDGAVRNERTVKDKESRTLSKWKDVDPSPLLYVHYGVEPLYEKTDCRATGLLKLRIPTMTPVLPSPLGSLLDLSIPLGRHCRDHIITTTTDVVSHHCREDLWSDFEPGVIYEPRVSSSESTEMS